MRALGQRIKNLKTWQKVALGFAIWNTTFSPGFASLSVSCTLPPSATFGGASASFGTSAGGMVSRCPSVR